MAAPLPLAQGIHHEHLLTRVRLLKGQRIQIRLPDQLMIDGCLLTVGSDYLEIGNGGLPTLIPLDRILYLQPYKE